MALFIYISAVITKAKLASIGDGVLGEPPPHYLPFFSDPKKQVMGGCTLPSITHDGAVFVISIIIWLIRSPVSKICDGNIIIINNIK